MLPRSEPPMPQLSVVLSAVRLVRSRRRFGSAAILICGLLFASPATATPIVLNFDNFFSGGCETFVNTGLGTGCLLYHFPNGMIATGSTNGFYSGGTIVNADSQHFIQVDSPTLFDL